MYVCWTWLLLSPWPTLLNQLRSVDVLHPQFVRKTISEGNVVTCHKQAILILQHALYITFVHSVYVLGFRYSVLCWGRSVFWYFFFTSLLINISKIFAVNPPSLRAFTITGDAWSSSAKCRGNGSSMQLTWPYAARDTTAPHVFQSVDITNEKVVTYQIALCKDLHPVNL